MRKKIKTLIVDDSLFIRVMLKKILSEYDNDFEIVGMASNGQEAVDFIVKNEDVDLITLDIKMPIKDGIQALKEILAIRKIAIVMISSLTRDSADITLKALELGAVDFITKSSNEADNNFFNLKDEMIRKLKVAANANLDNVVIGKKKNPITQKSVESILCIGSSTGGPSALKVIFAGLRKEFTPPIIVAQHMPEGKYSKSLADNLNQYTYNTVKIIEDGEEILNNVVYICPGGYNVEIIDRKNKYFLSLNKVKEGYYMPSVNCLFKSLAKVKNVQKGAIILTGMGNDGLDGAIELYNQDAKIIAESYESCVVYGMPRKIAECAEIKKKKVLSLEQIKDLLNKEI